MSYASADLDRRLNNVIRIGTICAVDAPSATAVVDFGEFKSPAVPVGQLRAGAMQFYWMPTVGEQVLVACEGGEVEHGVIIASLYAGNAPSIDGTVARINLAGGKMVIDGNLEVTGDVIAKGISLTQHKHPETGLKTGEPI